MCGYLEVPEVLGLPSFCGWLLTRYASKRALASIPALSLSHFLTRPIRTR